MKLSNFGCKYLHTRWAARDFLHCFSYLTQFCSAHFFSLLLQRESDRVTRNVSASAVRQKSITVPSLPLWFLIISGKCISFIRPHCMCTYRTVRRLLARTDEHYFWQVGGKKCSLVLANQHLGFSGSFDHSGLAPCNWWPRRERLGPPETSREAKEWAQEVLSLLLHLHRRVALSSFSCFFLLFFFSWLVNQCFMPNEQLVQEGLRETYLRATKWLGEILSQIFAPSVKNGRQQTWAQVPCPLTNASQTSDEKLNPKEQIWLLESFGRKRFCTSPTPLPSRGKAGQHFCVAVGNSPPRLTSPWFLKL